MVADHEDQPENAKEETVTEEAAINEAATQQPAQKEAENMVNRAQPNDLDTAPHQVADIKNFENVLKDTALKSAQKIRQVLRTVHQQDSTLLNNSEVYSYLKDKLASKLGVSKALVDKERRRIFEQAASGDEDNPTFEDKPYNSQNQTITGNETSTASEGKGDTAPPIAPASPAISDGESTSGGGFAEPAVIVPWKGRQVKAIFKMINYLAASRLPEWPPLTKEELEDIEEAMTPFFNRHFPKQGEKAEDIAALITLGTIFGNRGLNIVEYRIFGKPLEEVKKRYQQQAADGDQ